MIKIIMYIDKIIKNKKDKLDQSLQGGKLKKYIENKGISIIGEFKIASPIKGKIIENFNINEILAFYDELKIKGFSVVTEEEFFKGNIDYIRQIKEITSIPILRKDFIIDKYQLYETKVLKADAITLTPKILGNNLKEFYKISKNIGLDVLVEVHDKEDLKLALDCDSEIIGINNLDLETFKVNLKKTEILLKMIPKGKLVISESGIGGICDIKHLRELGVDGVLIGELFMKNLNNEYFKREFKKFLYENI